MEDSAREVTFSAVCFGVCRNSQGTLDTDKLFTGQRLDDTGLYYYNARYYDATIGRFISADTIVQDYTNPQTLNRYSYCNNNPLKYIDPSGHSYIGKAIKKLIDIATGGGGSSGGGESGGGGSGGSGGGSGGGGGNSPTPIPLPVHLMRPPGFVECPCSGGISFGLLDFFQGFLDLVGLIPLLGEPADALNGIIYSARGDYANAAFSFGATIPFFGWGATVGKWGYRGVKFVDGLIDVSRGYDSFRALKRVIGSPGEGNAWHHIVEQCQTAKSGFNPRLIQNPDNVLAVDVATHAKISGYYSSIDPRYSETMRVRDWLAGQSFEYQYNFGVDVLARFGY